MQRVVGALLIVLAIGLAAYAWVLSKDMAAVRPPVTQPVVVAAQRIAAGTVLTPDKLQLMEFPTPPAGSYREIAPLLGRLAPVDIAAGEPLLQERLEGNGAAAVKRLQPGERAVAIRVDEVIAVGNRLAPGDVVDVFATFRRNNDEIADSQARLLLGGLRILAIGSQAGEARKGSGNLRTVADTPRTAVLAVPLAEVEKLALAAEAGRLLLALRPLESPAGETQGVSSATLLSPEAQAVNLRTLTGNTTQRAAAQAGTAPRRAASGATVKVMHGLKERTVRVSMKRNGAGQ